MSSLLKVGLYSCMLGFRTSSIFCFTRERISFLLFNAAAFISSSKSSGKGSATTVLSVKNCPKLYLHAIFLYFLHDLLWLCVWYFFTNSCNSRSVSLSGKYVGLHSLYSLPLSHVLVWGSQMSILMHEGEENLSFEILYEEQKILSFQLDVH